MFGKKLTKAITGPFLVVAALSIMVACGPSAQPGEPSTGAGGQAPEKQAAGGLEVAKERGGRLNMTGISFGNPNDPHLVATAAGRTYAVPIANGLLARDIWDPKAPIVPELAKSWELSKDGKSYTFKLREGIKFHNVPPVNGREFTSEDAKYTILRLIADPSVIVEKWKPRFQRRTEFPEFQSIQTPDKYTMVINLKEPFAPFIDSIAHPGSLVIPREFIESFPEKIILEGTIGTGPFIPVEYRNQQLATYKKNPDYWKKDSQGGQLPYLDELYGIYFGDAQTALASFRAGQLDVAAPTTKSMMDNVKRDVPGAHTLITPKASLANFRLNTKFKPFQDVRVRRAIHLVVDRYQFIDLITEGLGVVSGPVTSPVFPEVTNTIDWLMQQPGYRKDKTQDIVEAKRLMKEAGYESGFALQGLFTVGSASGDEAALLADQLKVINITLKPEQVDYAGQWVPRSTNGEFELSQMTHTVATDVDSVLAVHIMTGGSRNYGQFGNAAIDDLIRKEQLATTVEERRKYAQDAEKLVFEQAPMIFTYTRTALVIAQPWVHNAADGPVIGHDINMVEKVWMEKR